MLLTVLAVVLALSTAVGASYNESPMLAELVAAGHLPPVEDRLPEVPFVVGPDVLASEEILPDWQPGKYGGEMRAATASVNFNPDFFLGNVQPLMIGTAGREADVKPNIVEALEVNEDNTVFTFTMRRGLKWSDGVPVTTEDVRFAVEDVLMEQDITPVFPMRYRAGGQAEGTPMELEIIDDFTFSLAFDEPYGAFLTEISITGWIGYNELIKPKHYLVQYHAKYTPIEDMRDALAAEELEDEWYQLFGIRDVGQWDMMQPPAIGFPVLTPWMLVEGPSGFITMERNPYYFKVDIEGNQLPYIDRLVSEQVSDVDMVNMKILTGEVDYCRESSSAANMAMYVANEERANFRTMRYADAGAQTVLFLNHTYDDPIWRQLMSDVRFREAVALAIDHQEIIDTVYFGLAPLPHTTPSDYDPERAEALLDAIGMAGRDSDGYRLGPDGEPFELYIEMAPYVPAHPLAAEMVTEHLRAVGINTTMRQLSTTLAGQRRDANEVMATILWVHTVTWEAGTSRDYLPSNLWAPLWRTWYDTDGASGEEPPAEIMELFAIHERIIQAVPATDDFNAAFEELYTFYQEFIPIIVLVEGHIEPITVSRDLRNVPESGAANLVNLLAFEQMFFDR